MNPVELLTVGLWHPSTGDFAILHGSLIALAQAGIPVIPVSRSSGERQCIVGGGYLYARKQVPGGFSALLEPFKIKGPHILNAVGVNFDGYGDFEFSFFKDWNYLSARDLESAEEIQKWVDQKVYSVPCTAMYVAPMEWEFLVEHPMYHFCRKYTPGEFVVVDLDPSLAAWSNKLKQAVIVDTRPWLPRKWKGKHPLFPPSHSAEMLLTLIRNAKAVITRSLHLGILSLSAGTPFVFYDIENHPDDVDVYKSYRYWKRAGFSEVIFRGKDPLEHAMSLRTQMNKVREHEFLALHEHVQRMIAACRR